MGSDLLSDIPQLLAEVFDQGAIVWRAEIGEGEWAALTGARLANRREVAGYDEKRDRERLMIHATLSVPSASTELHHAYEIKEADGTRWEVRDRQVDSDTGVRLYDVQRDPTIRHAADRGRLS